MPTKNEMAATLSRAEAISQGILDSNAVQASMRSRSRKLFGFSRKAEPEDIPETPYVYIYSISEFGGQVRLGVGFPMFEVEACPEGQSHGPACVVKAAYFYEEAKIDQTEHTFISGNKVANCILSVGAGEQTRNDRRLVGWFRSDNDPPRAEEVKAAKDIYGKECKRLMAEANEFHRQSKGIEIHELHRMAAKYLGQKVAWDNPITKMIPCVGCGESIPENSVHHAVSTCMAVQEGKWPEAIARGIKRLDDAPPMVKLEMEQQVHDAKQELKRKRSEEQA